MDAYPLAKHFDEVKNLIKTHGQGMNNEDLGDIYGLFKQATVGDNTSEKPSFYQFTEKGKWEAWNKHKGKSSDQAKHEYVQVAVKYFPAELKAKYSS